jgi:hypothetical protein
MSQIRRRSICSIVVSLVVSLNAAGQPPKVAVEQAAINGKVLDLSSIPRAAEVQVYQVTTIDGHRELLSRCLTQTDTDGIFHCPALNTGQFFVAIRPRFDNPSSKLPLTPVTSLQPVPRLVFYGGTTDFERAEPIILENGKDFWCQISLPNRSGSTISGDGTLIPTNSTYRLQAIRGNLAFEVGIRPRKNLKTQRFNAFDVPDGHYRLTVLARGSLKISTATLVVLGGDVTSVKLEDLPASSIVGTIKWPSGEPPIQVMLYRADDSRPKFTSPIKDGKFQFDSVPAGDYFIGLPVDRGLYVTSITKDNQSSSYTKLTVSGATDVENITLETLMTAPNVIGTLKGVKPEDHLRAQILLRSEKTGQIYTHVLPLDGHFSLVGIPPGEYKSFAWDTSKEWPYRDPEFLKLHDRDAVYLTVEKSTPTHADNMALIR